VREEEDSKMRGCPNFAASSVLLFECIAKPVRGTTTPHFHAYYQEDAAIFSIEPIEMARGALPTRQRRLVEAWAELHQQELLNDWKRLESGRAALPIEPLK
jgi:hypothetical protein